MKTDAEFINDSAAPGKAGMEGSEGDVSNFTGKQPATSEHVSMDRIFAKGRNFVDEKGRIRIFHGVNLVCKDKTKGYVGDWDKSDFEELSRMGLNLVRLGLIWDGLEPEPGQYNDTYLDRVENILDLCAGYGIYVLLDMHQDLYSVRFSDGAPEWATLTDGLPEPEPGHIWSDAYLSSEAIQRAFDHFWYNDAARDGIGLQDHLAGCWKHIARRFGSRPEVIGYDFLNEPFPGSKAPGIFGSLMDSFSNVESGITGMPRKSVEEAAGDFFDPVKRMDALKLLDNRQFYGDFISAAGNESAEFDSGLLGAFYSRMAEAVRTVTPNGILFSENSYFSNTGLPSGIRPIVCNGKSEWQQGFAPHGYDLVVDTPLVGSGASENRAGVIFDNHLTTQQRLDVPVIVGEWGGFVSSRDIDRHCNFLLDTFDRNGWSFAYWAWEGINTRAVELIKRDYPIAVAGKLIYFKYDQASASFFMEWDVIPAIDAPTVICLPEGLKGRKLAVTPYEPHKIVGVNGAMHMVIETKGTGRYTIQVC